MSKKRKTWIRFTAIAAALVGLYLTNGAALQATAIPQCDGLEFSCNDTADCDASCLEWTGEGWNATTCGQFNGGYQNGMCDGDSCWHWCDVLICEATCYSGGEQTYCGAITHEC